MPSRNNIIGTFEDLEGNALANGYIVLQLCTDAQIPTVGQVVSDHKITITLDGTGSIPANTGVWPNDALNPTNTKYIFTVYSQTGQLVFGPKPLFIFSSPSPFDLTLADWVNTNPYIPPPPPPNPPPPPPPPPGIAPVWPTFSMPNGTIGTAYSQSWDLSPASTPTTYTVVAGALPTGLTLNNVSGDIGSLTGTPTVAGVYSFNIRATNAYGTSDASFTITIVAAEVWTTISNVQLLPNWLQPGNVGNSGGGSTKPHGTYTWTTNLDNTVTVAITPAASFDDFFFYNKMTGLNPSTFPKKFKYHMEFTFPTGNLAKCQGYEFQLQTSDGAYTYNMAWQAELHQYHAWRYFHYTGVAGTGGWVNTSIPDTQTENVTCVVDAEFWLDSVAKTCTHKYLTVNGVTHNINVTQAAVNKNESKYLHCAIQLDSLSTFPAYEIIFKADVSYVL